MCKNAELDTISSSDLADECLRQLSGTSLKRDIQNAVFGRLQGLESGKHNTEDYVPEEPDWIISGRIKWLKRVSKGLESLATELGELFFDKNKSFFINFR